MRSVLITGVSTGIGADAAQLFLDKGWRVFGSVRREEDAVSLNQNDHFTPLIFDVTDRDAVEDAGAHVRKSLSGDTLDVLINNAGIAKYGPLMSIPVEEVRQNFEVNVLGVLNAVQVFLPSLGATMDHTGPRGRIINIGSVSGRFVMPLLGPYCASKYALLAVSHALRRELLAYDIPVSLIDPSSARSAIWDKARNSDTHLKGTAYESIESVKEKLIAKQEKGALPPRKISEVIWKVANAKRPKPRYLVTPNNLIHRIVHGIPDRWLDKLVKRALGSSDAASAQFWK